MMFGGYRKGQEELPRVIHISIARYHRELPQPGEALEFLVTIHEEGTGITWKQNVTIDPTTEALLVEATNDLLLWSVNLALTREKAAQRAKELGAQLHQSFLGVVRKSWDDYAYRNPARCDETVLNLPWELIAGRKVQPLWKSPLDDW
jgi:hypothetical protein